MHDLEQKKQEKKFFVNIAQQNQILNKNFLKILKKQVFKLFLIVFYIFVLKFLIFGNFVFFLKIKKSADFAEFLKFTLHTQT